jgi:hypothetical protein
MSPSAAELHRLEVLSAKLSTFVAMDALVIVVGRVDILFSLDVAANLSLVDVCLCSFFHIFLVVAFQLL